MDDKSYETEFFNLVMGLQGSAWMLLGKVMNPMTGKIEKNLDAAKTTIEALKMLQVKTKGNLTEGEDALLKNAIQQLEVNFVEALNSKEPNTPKPESSEPNVTPEKTKEAGTPEQAPAGDPSPEEKKEDKENTQSEDKPKQEKSKEKKQKPAKKKD